MPTLSCSNFKICLMSNSSSIVTKFIFTSFILSSSPKRLSAAFLRIWAAFLQASTIFSTFCKSILRLKPNSSKQPAFIRLSKTFLLTLNGSILETKSSMLLNSPFASRSAMMFSIAAPPTPLIAPSPNMMPS